MEELEKTGPWSSVSLDLIAVAIAVGLTPGGSSWLLPTAGTNGPRWR
jgi:hypothetical protein